MYRALRLVYRALRLVYRDWDPETGDPRLVTRDWYPETGDRDWYPETGVPSIAWCTEHGLVYRAWPGVPV